MTTFTPGKTLAELGIETGMKSSGKKAAEPIKIKIVPNLRNSVNVREIKNGWLLCVERHGDIDGKWHNETEEIYFSEKPVIEVETTE